MNIAFGAVSCVPLGATAAGNNDTDTLTAGLTWTVDDDRLLPVLSTRVDDVRTGVTMAVGFRWLGLDALPVGCLDELGRDLSSVVFFFGRVSVTVVGVGAQCVQNVTAVVQSVGDGTVVEAEAVAGQ